MGGGTPPADPITCFGGRTVYRQHLGHLRDPIVAILLDFVSSTIQAYFIHSPHSIPRGCSSSMTFRMPSTVPVLDIGTSSVKTRGLAERSVRSAYDRAEKPVASLGAHNSYTLLCEISGP